MSAREQLPAPAAPSDASSPTKLSVAVLFVSNFAPLAAGIVPELLNSSGDVATSCTPTPVDPGIAACELRGPVVPDWAHISLKLPIELAGVGHRRVLLPGGRTDHLIEIEVHLLATAEGRPYLDSIAVRRSAPTPPALTSYTGSPPSFGERHLLEDLIVHNGTTEPIELLTGHAITGSRVCFCLGCLNTSPFDAIMPGEAKRIPVCLGGALQCESSLTSSSAIDVRLTARGAPHDVPVASEAWPVKAPAITDQPLYELTTSMATR